MATIKHEYIPHTAVLANSKALQDSVDELKAVGGYSPATNTFCPLNLTNVNIFVGDDDKLTIYAESLFITISAAIEAGIIDNMQWPSQLFANRESFERFIETLASYEECFKLQDPWWSALKAVVCPPSEEEGHATAEDLAERLHEAFLDLPEQWQ